MVELVGPRVRLREHTPEDLDAMHAWLGDREVMRFLSWGTSSLDETRAHLAECIAEQARPRAERL
ncbi:MAG: GNAT family N-acetyltransferase [Proteobacteria bacterium]|nr:GNAT family N-acetyltransferase [Pseudomonadota bacterium]